MATWQHLRSSTANKRPTTSLADGRIAINTNTASPGLFFKDSAGTGIVKVGPVHVGTTAPNSVPASGGSSGNYLGEQWLDTSVSPAQMKVWNGSTWVGVVADELPVSKLQDGAARQLIQTDAAGTGVEWTSNVDVPGTLDVTSTATFDSIAQHPLGIAAAPTITFTGDTDTGVYSPGADQVAISTGGTERARIDSSGRLLVGTSTSRGTPASIAAEARLQLEGSNNNTSAFSITNTTNGAAGRGPNIRTARIRGTGAVASDDSLGQWSGWGHDGSDFMEGARIDFQVDGTPGANDMPSRIVFSTTADGVSSPTERLCITNDGVIAYNQAAPNVETAATTLLVAELKIGIIQYTGAAATLTLPTGTLTEGGFSGIYTNMTFEWSVINTGSGTCTIGNGTGHTVTGSATVAAGASGRFASRRTAANTFVSYRLS